MGRRNKKGRQTGYAILPFAVAFLLDAACGLGHLVDGGPASPLDRAASALLGVAGVAAFAYFHSVRPLRRPPRPRPPIPLSSEQTYQLQRTAGRSTLDGAQAKVFALAVLTPQLIRQRICERYVPGQRTLLRSVDVLVQLPKTAFLEPDAAHPPASPVRYKDTSPRYVEERTIFFPILLPDKGRLYDDLTVTDGSGRPLPALAYAQYLQLVARVLRTLLLKAYRTHRHTGLPAPALEYERRALELVMHRGQVDPGTIDRLIGQIRTLAPPDPGSLALFRELVRTLSTRYALVATAHCDLQRRLSYRYQETMIPAMERTGFKAMADWVRVFFGARPVEIGVDLGNAWTCQSYHAFVDSAAGLFLFDQEVVGIDSYLAGKGPVHGIPPYYRLRRRLGQSYGHFYARFLPGPRDGEPPPWLRLSFREVPPGSTFRAMIAALAAAVLIWGTGVIGDGAAEAGAPGYLLTFPALAAAWLGFTAPAPRLLEATLTTRFSLLVTATTSLLASGLYALDKTGATPARLRGELPPGVDLWGITDTSWAVLALAAVANAAVTLYVSCVRTWEFKHLSSRPTDLTAGGSRR